MVGCTSGLAGCGRARLEGERPVVGCTRGEQPVVGRKIASSRWSGEGERPLVGCRRGLAVPGQPGCRSVAYPPAARSAAVEARDDLVELCDGAVEVVVDDDETELVAGGEFLLGDAQTALDVLGRVGAASGQALT